MGIPSVAVAVLVLAGAVAFGATRQKKVGTFLGIPYDWRRPTRSLIRERFWNPDDRRVLTPKVFGWGWSINLAALARRLRGG
jgi:uncharacterized membrane protein